ncbi:MAG: thiol:disulfide interchange protein, partial [Muribaculaceae bacterium]|nr:thiol:disulfide interchange protein [Muribaculaceae bacterium]
MVLLLTIFAAVAQDGVSWTFRLVGDNTPTPSIEATAKIESGYHIFSLDNPPGGSNPLEFHFDLKGCKLDGKPTANKAYIKEYDEIFEVNQHFYTGTVSFTQKLKAVDPTFSVVWEIKGQSCNDMGCMPIFASHTFTGKAPIVQPDSKETDKEIEEQKVSDDQSQELAEMTDSLQRAEAPLMPAANLSDIHADSSWWENVEAELKVFSDDPGQQTRSLLYIFLAGFIGGLIALVTPCVWPMIPMTVSFFLKQNKTKRKSVMTAAVYGLSIIVIYVGLGLIVTALFGASALNELATSAGFNIAFFILLVIFAISFMGGFELTLPSSWTNKMDSKVDSTTGYLSIFFMAFTLCLVSFSCTGPIIGTLLVEA